MKYTIESFKEKFNMPASEVVRFLDDLKESIPNEDFGICANLSDTIFDEELEGVKYVVGYDIVKNFSIGWKHYTGNEVYPVPTCTSGSLWKGEQLEYRLNLIDYIIEQLKEIK